MHPVNIYNRFVINFVLAILIAACGSDEAPPPPTANSICDKWPATTCSPLTVPLDWSQPKGRKLQLEIVTRAPTQAIAGGRSIWLVAGGPGDDGAYFFQGESNFSALLEAGHTLHLLTPRGVAEGALLSCPDQQSEQSEDGTSISPTEAAPCVARLTADWGEENLEHFSTANAARDLAAAISAVAKKDTAPVVVYGVSYGTYVVQALLAEATTTIESAILDSTLPPQANIFEQAIQGETEATRLFQHCKNDSTCRGHLGEQPLEAVDEALAALDGSCASLAEIGVDANTLRSVLGLLGGRFGRSLAVFAPALVDRIRRCDARDQREIISFFEAASGTAQMTGNEAVFQHISNSELRKVEDLNALIGAHQALRFGAWDDDAYQTYLAWPNHGMGSGTPQPPIKRPVLILQGELDTVTPAAWAQQAQAALGATTVVIPYAPHGVVLSATADDGECIATIVSQFIAQPEGAVDSSCTAEIPGLDFAGKSAAVRELAEGFFKSPQLWLK